MENYSGENRCAADFMDIASLRDVQLSRLQKIVAHAYKNVEFFRNRMDEKGPSNLRICL